jgi:class 3 adenylate cyclase
VRHGEPGAREVLPRVRGAARLYASLRETRKTVTVVFCDVTGSTALGESVDPEALRALLARYFEQMKAILERHGGTVEKFIGDAVMAVFGVPVLHEDDALRAVRAAAEMRDALPGLGVQARIGVNTGEVVAGTGEVLVTGDAVNVAARLEQAAPACEVYLGAKTAQLAHGALEVEPVERVEPLELKGKSDPVKAFRMLAVTGAETRRRFDGTLLGRERERGLLREAFDLAVSDRVCQLFTILGVAGVGKSRLVAECLRGLDATVVRGRCLSYGEGITYWPVVEAVKQLRPEEREFDERVAGPLNVLLGEEAVASKEEIAFAVRRLFEEAARERPLVVVWDDLHWAEEAFLDLVEHVADWSRDAPIMLLCMARPELLDRRAGWAGGKFHAATVLLEPLGSEASDQLLAQLAGDLEDGLRDRILAAAQGNPLFVEEMVTNAGRSAGRRDRGAAEHPGVARGAPRPAPRSRAGGARARRRRGAGLPPFGGGGAGSRRRPGGLSSARPRAKRARAPGSGATFGRRGVSVPPHPDPRGGVRGAPERDEGGVARAIRRLARETRRQPVELDEIVGYHLEQACRYLRDLGHDEPRALELAERAHDRLAAGGRAALARDDARAAATLLARSIELIEAGDPRRGDALVDLAEARWESDDLHKSRETAGQALEIARAFGDEHVEALARIAWISASALIDPTATGEAALAEIERLVSVIARFHDDE